MHDSSQRREQRKYRSEIFVRSPANGGSGESRPMSLKHQTAGQKENLPLANTRKKKKKEGKKKKGKRTMKRKKE
jgi:hypothetical protein